MTAPLRGTRIAHIGIAVESLEAILPLYRDLLGMPEVPLDDADGPVLVLIGEVYAGLLDVAVREAGDVSVVLDGALEQRM